MYSVSFLCVNFYFCMCLCLFMSSSRCRGLRVISGGLDYTHLRTMDDSGGLITLCSTMCPGDLANLVPSQETANVSTYLHLKVRQCTSSFRLSFPFSQKICFSVFVDTHIYDGYSLLPISLFHSLRGMGR